MEGLSLTPEQQTETEENGTLFCSDRGAREELLKVGNCLSLVGPHPAIRICNWCEIDTTTAPPGLYLPFEVGLERTPYPTCFMDGDTFDPEKCKQIVHNYRHLPPEWQLQFQVPITRLNQAMRGHHKTDRAIDLGITLEALLTKEGTMVNPTTGKTSISYTIKTRGADKLGGGDEQERTKIRTMLGSFYGVRSTAVHTGQFNERNQPLVNDTIKLAAQLIVREIEAASKIT